jgi:hypothetical protein
MNDSASYRELMKKLKGLLEKKSNIEKSSVLVDNKIKVTDCMHIELHDERAVLRQVAADVEP